MQKIIKLIKGLWALIKQPSLINLVIDDAGQWQNSCLKKHPHVPSLPVLPWDSVVPEEINLKLCFLDGGSMPTDIALLKALAKRLPANAAYFEIGTWRGESVYNVAELLPDCTTLNLSALEMKNMGWALKYAELHGIVSKKNPNILHLEGNTLTYDFGALNKKYDLIFIDGDHSYAMVKHDTQQVWQHLCHEATMVVWHDYAFNPEKIRHEVLQGILDAVPQQYHQYLYHVENSMCAVYLPQKMATSHFESPREPKHLFDLKLSKTDF